jgi:hypothetical protein
MPLHPAPAIVLLLVLTLTTLPTLTVAASRTYKCLVDEVTTLRRHLEANHSVSGLNMIRLYAML